MKSVWQSEAQAELLQRMKKLSPETPAQWGQMNSSRMLAHLTDALKMAMGELEVPSKNMIFRYTPFRQLIIYWLPFPKGAPTAPQLIERVPGEWESEVEQLNSAMSRLVAQSQRTEWPEHPAFGKLSTKDWGVLIYKHMDHHFKQFGV